MMNTNDNIGQFLSENNPRIVPPSNTGLPPPLPPRPANTMQIYNPYQQLQQQQQQQQQQQYFGTSGHSIYPPSYGSFYGGHHRMGDTNSFVRLAEESSRPAFQSVETIVSAVSSVAAMLESSLAAMMSSFRALLGVADQCGRLRAQLSQVLTTLAVIRLLRKVWRKILVIMRLKPANYAEAQSAWDEALFGNDRSSAGVDLLMAQISHSKNSAHWSTLFFWSIVFAAPWLIYKLASRIITNVEESRKWTIGVGEHYEAVSLYDFHAIGENELAFTAGEMLRIAPKDQQPSIRGWILASSSDGQRIGLVPINHVKIVTRKPVINSNNIRDI